MPNLFASAERLYKRFAGGNQRYNRRTDSRSNDGTNLSSNAMSSDSSTPWKNPAARANSSSNLASSSKSESNDLNWPPTASPRVAQPPGDLTAVSSESETEENEILNSGSRGLNDTHNHRLRQSLQRAKNADFESGADSQNRYPSAERLSSKAIEAFDEEEEDEDDSDQRNNSEEETDDETYGDPERSLDDKSCRDDKDTVDNVPRSYILNLQISQSRAGVRWSSDPPQPLVDILPKIRRGLAPPNTEFVRAFCQRQSCRCLLRGHDTLMLFPLFDAVLCEATWEKIKESQSFSSSSSSRSASHFLSRFQHGHSSGPSSETQANLIMFRQCRGWYEVMNENHEPVPHWTSVEEVRCAKPQAFLVRRDLKCLLAPSDLWLPSQTAERLASTPNNNGAPPLPPVSSRIVVEAANTKNITASTPFVLKPGTLLTYVDFLHDCTVTRGKKLRQISLILAVEKSRTQRQSDASSSPRRLFYIGTEDSSSQAVFPTKLALSPIAGPENISGVHTLSSLLRKFRLPLSIVPVAVPERKIHLGGIASSSLSLDSDSTNYATAQSSKPVNIFPTVPGITFTDKTFIRLRGLLRGDIMIVAPVDAPDRFFLITPTLLQDHLFQIGFTEDDRYQRLALGHRNRTINFISMAHPRDSLEYLLVYLKNITNKPRIVSTVGKNESVGRELWNRLKAGVLQTYEITPAMAKAMYAETGRDPRAGPGSDLTPDELDLMYDEMDDLYFFTRNGYYPPKSRQRRLKSTSSSQLVPSSMQQNIQQSTALPKNSLGGLSEFNRTSGIPSAEQLLAASLNISTYK
ncbi:unnamed protein product [Hymenolepis diminuta]|uniref:AAA domain-containing protein n=1 Tax=Hymenolepis diminuta TaxID=6216 RepID=A0A0R3SV32_HYMDI|nr:unnamed protein product [Hymenolepis diminuta]VUZ42633.1 unnamed protein product [Hymenolepis diminuta]